MMIGFYGIIANKNLVKKVIGLSIFQVSALLFYMSVSYIDNGAPPILQENIRLYSNPVPHVLMLTAIVVGIAVMAVGLAIIVRIKESYGTIEEDEIIDIDHQYNSEVEKREHAS
jgi:multicomponent Na+:H+ antiporter subunit C